MSSRRPLAVVVLRHHPLHHATPPHLQIEGITRDAVGDRAYVGPWLQTNDYLAYC
jgi:hypothetical protein